MPLPPVSTDDLQTAVFAYKEAGWNKAEAARRLGLPANTLKERLKTARKRGVAPKGGWPDAVSPVADKALSVAVHSQSKDRDGLRVFVVGDAHDSPKLPDKERFARMGALARNWGADRIVWIGDVLDLESLCGHVGDDTLKGRLKPSFLRDIESGKAALGEFRRGLQKHVPQDVTEGNHEGARVDRWEDNNPNAEGMYRRELDQLWQLNGIANHSFGVPLDIAGVDFVHIPLRADGKPYGGKLVAQTVANHAIRDMVFGHTHRGVDFPSPKCFNRLVRIVECGTSLPHGFIEPYARHSTGGWRWGVTLLTIRDGALASVELRDMREV